MTVDLERCNLRWFSDEADCPHCGDRVEIYQAFDSRNIYITRACIKCMPDKLSSYRDDVLYGPTYETEEPIEPEDY